jgi:hypothetical protein
VLPHDLRRGIGVAPAHRARGHSFRACELALRQLASARFPLEQLATRSFPLTQADHAIRALAGEVEEDVVHVSLLPWQDPAGNRASLLKV